jgi:hypothetical protein
VINLIEMVTVSHPAGQPQVRHVVPRIGQRLDDLEGFLGPGPVGQPACQLPPGVLVVGVGALAELPALVIFGQLVGLVQRQTATIVQDRELVRTDVHPPTSLRASSDHAPRPTTVTPTR